MFIQKKKEYIYFFYIRYRTLYYLFWHTLNHSRHLRSSDNHACQHDRFCFLFFGSKNHHTHTCTFTHSHTKLADINDTTAFSLFYLFHFSYFDKIRFFFFFWQRLFFFFFIFIFRSYTFTYFSFFIFIFGSYYIIYYAHPR